jgi:hypothetical protein
MNTILCNKIEININFREKGTYAEDVKTIINQ